MRGRDFWFAVSMALAFIITLMLFVYYIMNIYNA